MGYTKEDYIRIGEDWTSDVVLLEANEVKNRWSDDVELLTTYGYGPKKLDLFKALIAQLEARYKLYKSQVGEKLAARPTEANAIKTLKDWIQRGQGILDDLVNEDETVEKKLAALGSRIPTRAVKLQDFATPFLQILIDERARLDELAATDAFYKEGATAIADLKQAGENKVGRRDTKEVGTSQLDELDGQLYVEISKLNKRARQAHAAKGNNTRAGQYTFAHLVRNDPPKEQTPPTIPSTEDPSAPTPAKPTTT
jgi:hypothetical protein